MYDIIIVGAAPAGAYVAGLLEDEFNVLVLEDKKQPGGKACSGLLSKDVKNFIDVDDIIENEMNDCVVHSPSGLESKLKISQGVYAINRDTLDRFMVDRITSAKVIFNTRANFVSFGECVSVDTNKGRFEGRVVLGCDGSNSIVRRSLGVSPPEMVVGLMGMVEEKDSSGFEVWLDKREVGDGFLWRIPRGNMVEYGLLGSGVKFEQMEKFFKIRNYERRAAPIPVGFQKSYFDRCLLIGDSASQTKPWSFGGILYGFIAGQIAKNVLGRAFDQENFGEPTFKHYEDRWKEKIGKSITMGMMFREFYKDLDNKKIDELFKTINLSGLDEIDMDHPLAELVNIG